MFIYRCDDSESDVNLELCIETYIEQKTGCQSVYNLRKGNTSLPLCNSYKMDKQIGIMEEIKNMGEQRIFLLTGCLSR